MATITLEIHNKHKDTTTYFRPTVFPVHIGRDYSNEIILADPYVSAKHAILNMDEQEQYTLTHLGSENGMTLSGKILHENSSIQAGDYFELGDTRIRMVTPDTPVQLTRIRHNMVWYVDLLTKPLVAWALVLLMSSMALYLLYLETSEPFESKMIGMTFGSVVLLSLIWAGCWSFVGKAIKKKGLFHLQLSVFALCTLISIPVEIGIEYLVYAFSSSMFGMIADYANEMIFGAISLYLCLWIATNMQKSSRVITAVLIPCCFGLLVFSSQVWFDNNGWAELSSSTVLKPPFATTMPASKIDDYFSTTEKIINSITVESGVSVQ